VQLSPVIPLRNPEPFNHPDWFSELKLDGFRALAHCRLVSRSGHAFKQWPYVEVELAHAIRCESAVLEGEIVCLYNLLFHREWSHLVRSAVA
jgi:ATP-dependent DNA ligase